MIPRPSRFAIGALATVFAGLALSSAGFAQEPIPPVKTFIDYFLPVPIVSPLMTGVWGAPGVLPRDAKNGLEDPTMKQWCYWDGQILRAKDGKYHLFASRWDQAKGHGGWGGSHAVHAVSAKADICAGCGFMPPLPKPEFYVAAPILKPTRN